MAKGGVADVVLVTGRHMRRPDPEIHLLVTALEQQSIGVVIAPWDDATPWSSVPLVVVRSPWDYSDAHQEFLAWARGVAAVTNIVNPLEVLEWNSHKSYLLALASAGVPTVVTTLVPRGASDDDLARALAVYPGEIVIKPAVSVGAIGALRSASGSDDAAAHLAELASTGDVLVQPLARAVLDHGESSLIYFGGEFSHAIRKLPAPGDYRVQEHHGGRVVAHTPTEDEFAVAAATLAAAPAATAYARVDLVQVNGSAAVMELEAIEPQLFLDHDPDAAARFATHLATAACSDPALPATRQHSRARFALLRMHNSSALFRMHNSSALFRIHNSSALFRMHNSSALLRMHNRAKGAKEQDVRADPG